MTLLVAFGTIYALIAAVAYVEMTYTHDGEEASPEAKYIAAVASLFWGLLVIVSIPVYFMLEKGIRDAEVTDAHEQEFSSSRRGRRRP